MCMRREGGGQAPCLHASLGIERGTPIAEFFFEVFTCVYAEGGGVVKPPVSMPGPVPFLAFVWGTVVSPLLDLFLILAYVMGTAR